MTTDALSTPILDPLADPLVAPDPRDAFFDTSHLTKDLKKRTVRGGAVTLTAQAIKFIIKMGSTALLARLLMPSDFGLVGMVTVVTGFVEMFKDAGLGMATVQSETISHRQVSNLFWINVGLSLLIMVIILGLAPVIGWFYGDHRLVPLTAVLGLNMIFGGITVQPQALLRRRMMFWQLMTIDLVGMVVGLVVAAILAYFKYGYWALAASTGATAATVAGLSITLSGWVPSFVFRSADTRRLTSYGLFYASSSIVSYFQRNGDNAIVGYRFGAAILGTYGRAYALLLQPWQQLLAPISSVIEPSLCRLSNDPQKFIAVYKKSLNFATTMTFPLTIVMYILADPMVNALLGKQWSGVSPLLQLMVPAAFVGGARTAIGWILFPLGLPARMNSWCMISTPIMVLGFWTGSHFGAPGVAASLSICECLLFLIGIRYAAFGTFVTPNHISQAISIPLLWTITSFWCAIGSKRFHHSDVVEAAIFGTLYLCLPLAVVSRKYLHPLSTSKEDT